VAKKKVNIQSDKVFYHFPVNSGYFSRNSLGWRKEKDEWLVVSTDLRRIRRNEGKEGVSVHLTQGRIK
jgi:hypothetical protein